MTTVTVSEYRAIGNNAPWSKETVIETAPSKLTARRTIRLVEISEGWTPAGSLARWQEARYGVRFNEDGCLHGRQFKTIDEARATFEAWTK